MKRNAIIFAASLTLYIKLAGHAISHVYNKDSEVLSAYAKYVAKVIAVLEPLRRRK
jgi:hypothetical protein